jgi:chromosome segregation ATPase
MRDRTGVELDDDLFFGGPGKPDPIRPDALSARGISARNLSANDPNDRPWPTLPMPHPNPELAAVERKLAERERELALRCSQVAELHDLQKRQATELELAYSEIKDLGETIKSLQETVEQRDALVAAQQKKLSAVTRENAALVARFEAALKDAAAQREALTAEHQRQLAAAAREKASLQDRLDAAVRDTHEQSTRMLALETAYSERETVVTSAFADIDILNAKLASAGTEAERLVAAVEATQQRHRDECAELQAKIDDQAKRIETLFGDQNIQFRVRDTLAKRCEELAETINGLESAHKQTQTELEFQTGLGDFLETMLRVEREAAQEKAETAQATIEQLTAELARERAERIAAGETSEVMRQEIASLLAQLAARRLRSVTLDQAAA